MLAAILIQMLEVAASRWKQPPPITAPPEPSLDINDYKIFSRPVLKELIAGLGLKLISVSDQVKYKFYRFEGNKFTASMSDNFANTFLEVKVNGKTAWTLFNDGSDRVTIKLSYSVASTGYIDSMEATTKEIIKLFTKGTLVKIKRGGSTTKSTYTMEDDGNVKYKMEYV